MPQLQRRCPKSDVLLQLQERDGRLQDLWHRKIELRDVLVHVLCDLSLGRRGDAKIERGSHHGGYG